MTVTMACYIGLFSVIGLAPDQPAHVSDAYPVRVDGLKRVVGETATFFSSESPLCCVVRVAGLKPGDKVQGVWVAIEGEPKKTKEVGRSEVPAPENGGGRLPLYFDTGGKPLPPGEYGVEVRVNGEPKVMALFRVEPDPTARVADFTPLFVTPGKGGKLTGLTHEARVTLTRDRRNYFSLGFFETSQGGLGESWRATGWASPLVAAQLAGLNLAGTRVGYECDGFRLDGGSAGGLTTVAILAAARGEAIRRDATMTGTINPDGTVGPVGGISQKITAAAAAGKVTVLIPAGQRTEGDGEGVPFLDLVEHGRKLGVQVKEVGDVYAAYRHLVGKDVPRLSGDEAPEIEDQGARDRVAVVVKEWLARHAAGKEAYGRLGKGGKTPTLDRYVTEADKDAAAAGPLLRQGLPGAALARAYRAGIAVGVAERYTRTAELLATGGDQLLTDAEAAAKVGRVRLNEVDAQLVKAKADTLGELGGLTAAWSWWMKANAHQELAELHVAALKPAGKNAAERAFGAAYHLQMAEAYRQVALDYRRVSAGTGGARVPREVALAVTADLFNAAADANLSLFEAVVLAPAAAKAGVRADSIGVAFQLREPVYAEARLGQKFAAIAREESLSHLSPAVLGRAVIAYSASAFLTAKYYSLEAEEEKRVGVEVGRRFGPSRELTRVQHERAFLNMLDQADAQARRAINLLRANKVDATTCVLLYEAGRYLRESGSVDDKFDALSNYWLAFTQARVTAYLGNIQGPK